MQDVLSRIASVCRSARSLSLVLVHIIHGALCAALARANLYSVPSSRRLLTCVTVSAAFVSAAGGADVLERHLKTS